MQPFGNKLAEDSRVTPGQAEVAMMAPETVTHPNLSLFGCSGVIVGSVSARAMPAILRKLLDSSDLLLPAHICPAFHQLLEEALWGRDVASDCVLLTLFATAWCYAFPCAVVPLCIQLDRHYQTSYMNDSHMCRQAFAHALVSVCHPPITDFRPPPLMRMMHAVHLLSGLLASLARKLTEDLKVPLADLLLGHHHAEENSRVGS